MIELDEPQKLALQRIALVWSKAEFDGLGRWTEDQVLYSLITGELQKCSNFVQRAGAFIRNTPSSL